MLISLKSERYKGKSKQDLVSRQRKASVDAKRTRKLARQVHLLKHYDIHTLQAFATEAVTLAVANQKRAVANQKRWEDQHHLSITDHLTGLYNMRFLQDALTRELARALRKGTSLAVAMLDIDNFKKINDSEGGHLVGDAALVKMSEFLRSNVRPMDVLGRYAGDEFIVILTDLSLEEAFSKLEWIRTGIKSVKIRYDGHVLHPITVSIGLAFCMHGRMRPETIIASADTALYEAKKKGRDQVIVSQIK